MRRLMTPEEFASRAKNDLFPATEAALFRLAPAAVDLTEADNRVVRYVFSTGEVARDYHTVNPNGWDFSGFDNYRSFLWAHDSCSPPIGNVIDHEVRNNQLVGGVRYVDRDIFPFADMIFQMVKKRIVTAVSIAWRPLEWKWSSDRGRPGGIDFIRQDCLEISQVPVPAQVTAVLAARSYGIDTSPLVEWAEQILDGGGAVAVPRATLEQMRREAKMPNSKKQREMTGAADAETRARKRGLYEVAQLAWMLQELGWIQDCAQWEAEIEQDGSDIPGRLAKLLNDAGQILVDMTMEEVAELLADLADKGHDDVEAIEQAAKTDNQRALARLFILGRKASAPALAIRSAMAAETITMLRAGKVLSQANTDALTRAMEHHEETARCIRSVLDAAKPEDDADPETPPDDAARAVNEAAAATRARELEVLSAS